MALPARLVLLGHPVAHSLSPVFQNAALRACGLPVRYDALDVPADALEETLRSLVAEGAAGNVTIPHKAAVAARCDVLTPLARRLGAVNTWWVENGRLHGDNTDVGGFDDAVREVLPEIPDDLTIAVIGAGGSARAVVAAARAWPGATVRIWARRPDQARTLVTLGPEARTHVTEELMHVVQGAGLVVNTTPIGMRDAASPIDVRWLSPHATVVDLVYRRDGSTTLVRDARAAGLPAVDGLPMLIGQGARAFERWTGFVADRDVMRRAVGDAVQPRAGG